MSASSTRGIASRASNFLRSKHHPDRGAEADEITAVQHAYDAFQDELRRCTTNGLQSDRRGEGLGTALAGVTSVRDISLISIEWNALTYAGHTVWNVHA